MTWTRDEFEKLYARFTESGLSIRDFCFNEGIPQSHREQRTSDSHRPEELSLLWQ